MALPVGTIQYTLGVAPVTGCGFSWSADELDAALAGPVTEVVFDDAGRADLATLLSGLPDTEFDETAVREVLSDPKTPEDWRVGEAMAECYLVHHRNCHFPWPDGRDERKSGSSLPGADLVGFQSDEESDRFAFGEVKTSADHRYPPGAMHGETGLKQQLEDLRDKPALRNDLVKYLGHRATNALWREQFKRAASRYCRDTTDVRIFGLMVRDVPPHQDDLRVRVDRLRNGCPGNMHMELLALYLPASSIATLGGKAVQCRGGGKA